MQSVDSVQQIRQHMPLARPACSNCYPLPDAFAQDIAATRVFLDRQPAANLLMVEWPDVWQVYAQLWDPQLPVAFPQTNKPLLMEVVTRTDGERETPFLSYWRSQGFALAQVRNEYALKPSLLPASPAIAVRPPAQTEIGAAMVLFRTQLDVATVRLPYTLESSNMLCAFDQSGALLGALHASLAGRAGILEHLAVAPQARRHGIGKALLTTWLASPMGAERRLWVLADNAPAIALYRSVGFQPSGRKCYSLLKECNF